MIALQTKVRTPEVPQRQISYGDGIMSFGSCFSEHIGSYLRDLGHRILVNPYGTQYNPISMVHVIGRVLNANLYRENDVFEYGGLWHSNEHHGRFSTATREQYLTRINDNLIQCSKHIETTKFLLLTWGTAWIYHDNERGGTIVSNCHKRPERCFTRKLYSVSDLVEAILPTLQTLLEAYPDLQIITTISPIRHLRDGAHGNQLSKSTLLLMDNELGSILGERYHYYPAYEIMLDELRDYRFYADDLSHPSPLAQRIIREGFAKWAIEASALDLGENILRLKAQYQHRVLQSDHPENALRQEQLHLLIRSFLAKHPEVDVSSWFNG